MLHLTITVLALVLLGANAQFGLSSSQSLGVRGPIGANYNGYTNTGLYGRGGYGGGMNGYGGGNSGYYGGNSGYGNSGYYGGNSGYGGYGSQGGYYGSQGMSGGSSASLGVPGVGANLGLGLGR